MYDVHSHFIPPEVLDWLRDAAARSLISVDLQPGQTGRGPTLTVGGKWGFELKREFHDLGLYRDRQAEARVRRTLISPVPQLFLYDAPPAVTIEAAQVYNGALGAIASAYPEQFRVLVTLPLNQPEQAAQMLEAAVSRGAMGAIIGPAYAGKLLSDEFFTPLWEAADAHRALLFIHPLLNEDPRIQRNRMPNLIGVPWETTLCALDLILSGHLDRFPNARILLAHGGGFLPYQVGRYNQGYASWPAVKSKLQAPPEAYLRRFFYDNVLWHPASVRFLMDVVGADRVWPGSDFPFDLSVWPPASVVEEALAALEELFSAKL